MRTLHPQRCVRGQNARQQATWRACRQRTPVPVDPQVLFVANFHSAQALKHGTQPTEGLAWMELCPKSSSTNHDHAWSLTHSISTCIRHRCLAPQALRALLPCCHWHHQSVLPSMRRCLFCRGMAWSGGEFIKHANQETKPKDPKIPVDVGKIVTTKIPHF